MLDGVFFLFCGEVAIEATKKKPLLFARNDRGFAAKDKKNTLWFLGYMDIKATKNKQKHANKQMSY